MMARLSSIFSFPLLAKELTERAARPRTYWMRVVVALLMYTAFWFVIGRYLEETNPDPILVLGSGMRIFEAVVQGLFVAIYALVPALLCGVVTQEKERDSLVLLMLTNLRPWQIAIQKYVGGLIPALSFLLLGVPLIAVAYAYGGVTMLELAMTLLLLVLAVLQIGAIALWASCWCRTTVASFLTTYFVAGALFALPILGVIVDREWDVDLVPPEWRWLAAAHVPWFIFSKPSEFPNEYLGISTPIPGCCLHIAATAGFFMIAAIWHLPRRAFVPASYWLRRLFGALDRWLHRVNRYVGGIRFGKGPATLPDDLPLVWREKRTRALAQPEHLARLLLLCVIPIGFLTLLALAGGDRDEAKGLTVLAAVVAGIGIVTVGTAAANGIVNERVNQTFEILLTTPMTAASILRQKATALRPLAFIIAAPLLALFTLEAVLEAVMHSRLWLRSDHWHSSWLYVICAFVTVAVYLPLFTWFAIWMGLLCRTRLRAIASALGGIVLWVGLPILILAAAGVPEKDPYVSYLYIASPLFVPRANERHTLTNIHPDAPWIPVVVNFALCGGMLFFIRRHCLSKADSYLRG